MSFIHLNQRQRYQIEKYLAANLNIKAIAQALGLHRSTIYREIKRGHQDGQYKALIAHERALTRRAKSAANHSCYDNEVWQMVEQLLKQEWSPDEIHGRLKSAGSQGNWSISHQAIYNWIKRTRNDLNKTLRRYCPIKQWKTQKAAYPAGRESIRKRDKVALLRLTAGHWEGDTIRGKTPHHCIVTLVERKSLYSKLSPVLNKVADEVSLAINALLKGLPSLSLTLDNGSEFARFKKIHIQTYFADPGKPRQRSRNEYTNGLIRQYIHKKDRLALLTNQEIQEIEDRLNHRPRKSLGYRTPHEVLFDLLPTPVAIRT
jgi:IS30 family transposase